MFSDELNSAAKIFGTELDDEQIDKFEKFFRLVVEQNRTMNLTTLTESRDFVVKYVIDSLNKRVEFLRRVVTELFLQIFFNRTRKE